MGVGMFFSLFGTVLVVLIGLVRFPYGPRPLPGASPVPRGTRDVCLVLAYDYDQDAQWLPSRARLRTDTLPWNHDWLAAERWSPGRHVLDAGWRPAGPDSIDIAWHHSPIVRLPSPLRTPGDSLVGRMEDAGYTTLLFQGPQDSYRVVARRVSCADFPPAT